MWSEPETPIFASVLSDLHQARSDAETQAARLSRLVADLEALHEPDSNGDCPTCLTSSPCLTLRLLHGEVSYADACAAVRDRTIDLTGRSSTPPVPTLAELLAIPTPAIDRVFETLIGRGPAEPRGDAGAA